MLSSTITWSLEQRSVKSLLENSKNPRKMTKDQAEHLKSSVAKFGFCEPIVINLDGSIIGGHMRLKTAKTLGYNEVDVYVPSRSLTQDELDELTIRLNKNVGEWDFDILANSWDPAKLINWGFEEKELSIDIDLIKEKTYENECIKPDDDPVTKFGDLYELGNHRLLCGDSTDPDSVTKLLDGKTPVLMITDPPYGVNYDPEWRNYAEKGCRAIGKVKNDDKVNWALAWYLFPGNVAYVWHAGIHASEVQKSLEDAKFKIISQIIWVKQNFVLSRGDYHWKHEPCWYAVRESCNHNWQGSRNQSTVWEIDNLGSFRKSLQEDERTAHSTQKPIECMSIPIQNNSSIGEEIYDPFCGSGSTLIAAEKYTRIAFCMEIDPSYCDIIVKRWKKYRKEHNLDDSILCNGSLISDKFENLCHEQEKR